jgi:hypothetical protein
MSTDPIDHLKKAIANSVRAVMENDPGVSEYVVIEMMTRNFSAGVGPDQEADHLVGRVVESCARLAYYEPHLRRRLKELPADVAKVYDWSSFTA